MSQPLEVLPHDEHNKTLVANVHPPAWRNPEPAEQYNLVAIGAGTAGLVSAAAAAGLGAKHVALLEKQLMGGDCLNAGCVPSKALIRAARACAEVRDAAEFGIQVDGYRIDFAVIMERMRRLRTEISHHDSAKRFTDLGADVFFGEAKFTAEDSLEIDGKTLRFSRAVIATGTHAASLPIPGLDEAGFLTNETLFTLTELPKRLAVLGAGPIGCEMAQSFARFGADVTLLDVAPQILPREDADAAALVQAALERDGVTVWLDCKTSKIEKTGDAKTLCVDHQDEQIQLVVDAILVAAGRAPNVAGLNLEAAHVAYDEKVGVQVDDRLQTSNHRIFAAGDICSQYKFTHAADALARIAIQNALFPFKANANALTIPWCTYTDPEIAHIGLYEKEAQEKGLTVETFTQEMKDVDRAILDGDTDGFARIHVKKGTDQIVGATIVARHAGDMIAEVSLAMTGGLGLKTFSKTIHPYPTQIEALKKIGDAYSRTRLTATVSWLLKKWLAWRR